MTSGNLASHLRKLEEADYVKIRAWLSDARSRVVTPTPQGLRALANFIVELRKALG